VGSGRVDGDPVAEEGVVAVGEVWAQIGRAAQQRAKTTIFLFMGAIMEFEAYLVSDNRRLTYKKGSRLWNATVFGQQTS
jgi:hypothetical protein